MLQLGQLLGRPLVVIVVVGAPTAGARKRGEQRCREELDAAHGGGTAASLCAFVGIKIGWNDGV